MMTTVSTYYLFNWKKIIVCLRLYLQTNKTNILTNFILLLIHLKLSKGKLMYYLIVI